jgi:hypothetical protein
MQQRRRAGSEVHAALFHPSGIEIASVGEVFHAKRWIIPQGYGGFSGQKNQKLLQ